MTLNDAEFIRSKIATVRSATPTVRGTAQVTYENRNWRTTVIGSLPAYAEMHDLTPQVGHFFSEAEVRSRAGVAVIGLRVWSELFGGENPLGEWLRLGEERFRVIGVMTPRGTSLGMDLDEVAHVPVWRSMKMFNRTSLFRILAEDELSGEYAAKGLAGLGKTQLETGRTKESAATFARLLEHAPQSARAAEASLLHARSLEADGRDEAALAAYESVFKEFGGSEYAPRAMLAAAQLYEKLGWERVSSDDDGIVLRWCSKDGE